MEATWLELIDLMRYSLAAAVLTGVTCPLLGAFLLVRRTSFYGIALPQFATAGVVFGFVVLPWWVEYIGLGGLDLETALSDSHAAMNYHLVWAAVFTFAGLAVLSSFNRAGATEIGRVAGAFAIAHASTILFGRFSPFGLGFVEELMRGEILGIGVHELETLGVILGVVLVLVFLFHRDLLLVSYDREMAHVLGKRVRGFEGLLGLITGLTVSAGSMIVGPTLMFGLLVLPPLAARSWARSMSGFLVLSAGLGFVAVLGGVVLSFTWDLPLGAAIVGAAALLLVPGAIASRRKR